MKIPPAATLMSKRIFNDSYGKVIMVPDIETDSYTLEYISEKYIPLKGIMNLRVVINGYINFCKNQLADIPDVYKYIDDDTKRSNKASIYYLRKLIERQKNVNEKYNTVESIKINTEKTSLLRAYVEKKYT